MYQYTTSRIEDTEKLYDQLINSGRIIAGEAMSFPVKRGGVFEIMYRFPIHEAENKQGMAGGTYSFEVEPLYIRVQAKVCVLCVDEKLNILL
jgi:hypothetical protein